MALYEVGAAFGALACFFFGERYGRKWTTFGAAVTVLIGVIIQTTSFQLAQLIVARIVTGKEMLKTISWPSLLILRERSRCGRLYSDDSHVGW